MADSRTAILITIDPDHEGGYQCNPHDRRNWLSGQIGVGELIGTKYGITSQDMPGVDIKNLTPDQAVAYYSGGTYWKPLYCQINDQGVANKLFDMGVLFGVGTATKLLQRVVGVNPDGNFGPMTLAAVNAHDPGDLLRDYKTLLLDRDALIVAGHPEDAEFKDGWDRRVKS
jgi:lysozyme family protein